MNNILNKNEKREITSEDKKRELESEGNRILALSRRRLYISLRFFASALEALAPKMNANVKTVGTDGVTLYFRTPGLVDLSDENENLVNRAYIHMLLHCLFYHPFRGEKKDEELWKLSSDIAVESIIDSLEVKALGKLQSPLREEWYKRLKKELTILSADSVYSYLTQNRPDNDTLLRLSADFEVDDHTFWMRKRKDNDKTENDRNDKVKKNWEKLNRKVSAEADVFARRMGTEEGMLVSELKLENRRKRDLKEFLRKFTVIREEPRLSDEEFDLNFYTYGLSTYGNLPLIEPLETKESKKISELAIVIDTSGSCSDTAVKDFLSETYAILKNEESFFLRFKLHIIQADVRVISDELISSAEEFSKHMDDFTVYGNGGTDFRPAFSYITDKYEKGEFKDLKGVLYFTDGVGIYPEKRPPYRAAFVFLKKYGDYTGLTVPAWAEKLVLEEKQ